MIDLLENDVFCPTWLKKHDQPFLEGSENVASPYVRSVFEFVDSEHRFIKELTGLVTEVQLCENNDRASEFVSQLSQICRSFNVYFESLMLAIHLYSNSDNASNSELDFLGVIVKCDLNKVHVSQILLNFFDCPRSTPTKASILSLYVKSQYLRHLLPQNSAALHPIKQSLALIVRHIRTYPIFLKRLSSLVGAHLSLISEVIKHDLHVSLIRMNSYLEHFYNRFSTYDPTLWEDLATIDIQVSRLLGGSPNSIYTVLDSANDYKVLGMRAPIPKETVKRKASKRGRKSTDETLKRLIQQYGKLLQIKTKALDELRQSVMQHHEAITEFHQEQLNYGAKWEIHMEAPLIGCSTPLTAESHYIKSAWWSFHEKMKGCGSYVQAATDDLSERVQKPLDVIRCLCENATRRVRAYHRLLEGAEPALVNHELAKAASEWSEEMPIFLDYMDEAVELLMTTLNKITLEWTGYMIGTRRRKEFLDMNRHHHPLNGCKNADIISFYQSQFDMSMA